MKKSKLLKKDLSLLSEEDDMSTGTKKKPKLYHIPKEDSFIPIQDDSDEIKYKITKSKS